MSKQAGGRVAASLLAALMFVPPATASAAPLPLLVRKKKKSPKVTPADAEAKRTDVSERATALIATGEPAAAGVQLDNAAAEWGDPVLYLEGGDAYLQAAKENRELDMAEAAAERGYIALDILFFSLDSAADKNFKLVETSEVPGLIQRAKDLIEEAEALQGEIDSGTAAEDGPDPVVKKKKKKRKKRKPGNGKGFIIGGYAALAGGGGLLVMGAAGLIAGAVRQRQADSADVYGDDYDAVADKGRRANVIAGVGLALGGLAAAGGATMLIIGKRRQKKAAEDDKVISMSPIIGPGVGGAAVSGRF